MGAAAGDLLVGAAVADRARPGRRRCLGVVGRVGGSGGPVPRGRSDRRDRATGREPGRRCKWRPSSCAGGRGLGDRGVRRVRRRVGGGVVSGRAGGAGGRRGRGDRADGGVRRALGGGGVVLAVGAPDAGGGDRRCRGPRTRCAPQLGPLARPVLVRGRPSDRHRPDRRCRQRRRQCRQRIRPVPGLRCVPRDRVPAPGSRRCRCDDRHRVRPSRHHRSGRRPAARCPTGAHRFVRAEGSA